MVLAVATFSALPFVIIFGAIADDNTNTNNQEKGK
jgi:hypothetical protein